MSVAVGAMGGAGALPGPAEPRLPGVGAGTSGAPNPVEGMGERPPSTITGWVAAASWRGCTVLGDESIGWSPGAGRACAGS